MADSSCLIRLWYPLFQVDPSLQNLVTALHKPLRPLWVSQLTRVWIDEVPAPQELPFIPLYLVSASLPNVRQRRQLGGGSQPAGPIIAV